jgi:hypothetical protein
MLISLRTKPMTNSSIAGTGSPRLSGRQRRSLREDVTNGPEGTQRRRQVHVLHQRVVSVERRDGEDADAGLLGADDGHLVGRSGDQQHVRRWAFGQPAVLLDAQSATGQDRGGSLGHCQHDLGRRVGEAVGDRENLEQPAESPRRQRARLPGCGDLPFFTTWGCKRPSASLMQTSDVRRCAAPSTRSCRSDSRSRFDELTAREILELVGARSDPCRGRPGEKRTR